MLLDLLSPSNTVSFNTKVANLIGLEEAVYLSELMSVNEKAIKDGTILDDDFFIIDRDYLKSRTTLNISRQKEIEKRLCNEFKILKTKKNSENTFYIDIDLFTILFDGSVDKSSMDKIEKIAKKTTKDAQILSKKKHLKEVVETSNPELRKLFYEWIDGVYFRGDSLWPLLVKSNEQILREATSNIDEQIEIMKKFAASKYIYMNNFLENYYKQNPSMKPQAVKPERKANWSDKVF